VYTICIIHSVRLCAYDMDLKVTDKALGMQASIFGACPKPE